MSGDYGNEAVAVEGRDSRAIELAARRLMPPQYQEFIASIRGDAGISAATRGYWLEKYEMFVEWAAELAEQKQLVYWYENELDASRGNE